jgi:hypothetical protein
MQAGLQKLKGLGILDARTFIRTSVVIITTDAHRSDSA